MRKGEYLAIYPVYYDDTGSICGWSEIPFSPETNTLEELKSTLRLILDALDEDILEHEPTPTPGS
jgi:hypothetical protein